MHEKQFRKRDLPKKKMTTEEMRTIKLLSVLIGSTPAGPSDLCSIRLRNREHGGGIVRDSDL